MNTLFSISQKIRHTEHEGMQVFSMHVSDDIMTVVGSFPAGRMYDTERAGIVASMTARMLDQGTQTHTKEELHDTLEALGASVSFGSDSARGRFFVTGMTHDIRAILAIVGEMIQEPRFDPSDLGIMKKRMVAEIMTEQDNPHSVAMSVFLRTLFPEGHPHHIPTVKHLIALVENVSVDDIREFHTMYYGRGDVAIVGVGKTEHAVFADICRDVFGGLPLIPVDTVLISSPVTPSSRKIVHEKMEGKASSSIVIGGALPFAYYHDDYDAFMCGMHILGGGIFANRLNQEVREKRGLTYHIRSFVAGYEGLIPGYWSVMAMFPPRLLHEGLHVVLAEIEGIVEKGITTRELAEKKEELVGRFITMFDNRQAIASLVLGTYEQKLPTEYWDTYLSRVKALTILRVNGALRTYLHPKTLVIASAGEITKKKKTTSRKK